MKILTVKQAFEFLQVSEDVLYPLIAKGKIPAGKIKGQWRMIDEDLTEWLRSQYQATHPEKPCHSNKQESQTGRSVSGEYARILGLEKPRVS